MIVSKLEKKFEKKVNWNWKKVELENLTGTGRKWNWKKLENLTLKRFKIFLVEKNSVYFIKNMLKLFEINASAISSNKRLTHFLHSYVAHRQMNYSQNISSKKKNCLGKQEKNFIAFWQIMFNELIKTRKYPLNVNSFVSFMKQI